MEAPKTLQEEIKTLEEKLAEKKRELMDAGKEANHQEIAREALKEYSSQASPSAPQSQQTAGDEEEEYKKIAQKFAEEPHAKQIEELLKIASEKGILNAVKVARHLNNPHLLDDFHDRMVLEFLTPEK